MAFFPLDEVEKITDEDKRQDKIFEILNSMDPDDPPFLSNILIHSMEPAAVHLMEILASGQFPFVWKLQQLRTWDGKELGQDFGPGDCAIRKIPINRKKRNGDLVSSRTLSIARKDGSYERKYEKSKEFRLDRKGCFECGYSDAVYFLWNWGYNKKTRTAVTKKKEYSREPVDIRDHTKGTKIHVRNWKYAEQDKKDYAALPDLKTQKDK